MRYLAEKPDLTGDGMEIGPPHSALGGPCRRCWVYPRLEDDIHCRHCREILYRGRGLSTSSRHTLLVWGYVSECPRELFRERARTNKHRALDVFVPDENHFLIALDRYELKPWIQELVVYYGHDLRGLLQMFPTMGGGGNMDMGDILARAVHHEANFPMDRMRVRYYSSPQQLVRPHLREREGLLTFELSEFLNLLEMTEMVRTLLRPDEQKELYELRTIRDVKEQQFYWGRFLGRLEQRTRDMLTSWGIRQWPPNRIELIFELFDHVSFIQER